jgi:thiosulfate dehydrogenase
LGVLIGAAVVGCRGDEAGSGRPATPVAAAPAPAPTPTAFRIPPDSEIPTDQVGASIRRGRAILAATKDSLPRHVGNDLRCTSCHLDFGTRADASPWIGVYSRFPQYRSRNAKINVIQDRINDCFQRSLNGKALDLGGRDMADIIAYMAFLSRGVAPPGEVPGQGFPRMTPLEPDTAAGRGVYLSQCVRCHGADGQGLPNADSTALPRTYPPVWGPRSFTVGAGMARLRTAGSFIRHNMPFDRPGTLTDQQAFDVAGYMLSHSRPDFGPKALDWPNGDPPPDVAYPTNAAKPTRPR